MTTRKVSLLLGLASAFTMTVGCGQKPSTSDTKIIGGETVSASQSDARRWSTVAITTDVPMHEGAEPLLLTHHSFCSGTLIAPRLVVTAAHCIRNVDEDTGLSTEALTLGSEKDYVVHFDTTVSKGGHWVRASRVMSHPAWDSQLTLEGSPTKAPNDIGLIILSEDAPASAKPAKIASSTPDEGEDVYLAGYGVTKSRSIDDSGVLREVTTTFQGEDKAAKRLTVGETGHGACAGDSGGPLYFKVGNEFQLAGLTSTGAEFHGRCLGKENNYTDIRAYTSWINAQQR